MYWKEVNNGHHGKYVKVWADSTPENPITGEGPHEGIIDCVGDIPTLIVDKKRRYAFAWYWKVEIKN